MSLKRRILIIVAALALVGAGFAVFGNSSGAPSTNTDQTETSSEPTTNDKAQVDEQPLPSKPTTGASSQNGTQTNNQSIGVTISHLSQDSKTVYIRAFVDGATRGNCTLRFERTGYTRVERSAPITASGEAYTCQGFDIPKSEFPSKGTWNATISFEGNGKTGSSKPEAINIQ